MITKARFHAFMGPALLLDKSAFQALSADEHTACHFMFMENVTPVLLREISGDLAKVDGNRPPQLLVQTLADKFGGSGGTVNVDWEHLCLNSLGGQQVPMTGQIVVGPGPNRSVTHSSDGASMMIGPSAENYAIMRWAAAAFTDGEQQAAQRFRDAAQAFEMTAFAGRLRGEPLPMARTVDEIPEKVDLLLNEPQQSMVVLQWLVDQLRPLARAGALIPRLRRQVTGEWLRAGKPQWNACPYARHCARSLLALLVGERVLSTRPTNRIDAEYLLYLPFCHVFVSNDKLHRQLAPPLLGDYQNFVPLELFKKDLARFWQVRRGADAEHRRRMDRCFGGRPWPAPDSVLWASWEKYEPWKRSSGNRAIKLSDDELRSALDEAEQLVAKANASLPALH